MEYLWQGREINSESGMFAGSGRIRLLFPAEQILRVSAHTSGIVYEAGRDFRHEPGSAELYRTPDSRIAFLPDSVLHPVTGLRLHPDPDANAIDNAVDGKYLLFNNRNFMAQNQIDISYRCRERDLIFGIDRQLDRLPRVRALLAQGRGLRVTLIGDSISEGFNATKFTGIAPYAPPYIDQVCAELSRLGGGAVIPTNRALASTGIQHAGDRKELWCGDRPDLLVIAYGMNNFSAMPVLEFLSRMQEIMDQCRSASPETEFLILTFMTGHPRWRPTVPGPDEVYAGEMRRFAAARGPETALADVQAVWKKILQRKSFYDLSGNGVNHPNDYGHRIYASVLLEVLTGRTLLDA